MARNLLDNLNSIRIAGERCPPFVLHYGILHLVQFMDAYEGLMGHLAPDQKGPVACLSDLICGMFDHKDALVKMRNQWVAHLQDKDMSAEAPSIFVRRVGLPEDPGWYGETFDCAVIFADAVWALLPEIAIPASKKGAITAGAGPEEYAFDPNRVARNVRDRLEKARQKAENEYPDRPWGSLLGLDGGGPNKLGVDPS